MKTRKAIGFIAVGLAAGLALGSLGIAAAATASNSSTETTSAATAADQTGRGPGGPGGRGFGGMGDIPEALAELSGLTVEEVQTQREAGTSYAAIAKAEGVSTDDLVAATVKIETAELDAAVTAGTLTAAERTSILSSLEANIETALASTDAMRGPGGPGGPGKHGGLSGVGDIPEALAELSGLTVEEIETQRRAGTSYAAIAKAEGVSTDDLVAKTVEIEKDELDAAVNDSTITDAQRTSYLSSLQSTIEEAVSSTDAMRGPGGHGAPASQSTDNTTQSQ